MPELGGAFSTKDTFPELTADYGYEYDSDLEEEDSEEEEDEHDSGPALSEDSHENVCSPLCDCFAIMEKR